MSHGQTTPRLVPPARVPPEEPGRTFADVARLLFGLPAAERSRAAAVLPDSWVEPCWRALAAQCAEANAAANEERDADDIIAA